MTDHYPNFSILCDHGVEGGKCDAVGRFEWVATQGEWQPTGDTVSAPGREAVIYNEAIELTFLLRDRVGFWDFEPPPNPRDYRVHYEVKCRDRRCGDRVRIPGDHLQLVLAAISARHPSKWFQAFRDLAPSVTEDEFVITLAGLQRARNRIDELGLFEQRT